MKLCATQVAQGDQHYLRQSADAAKHKSLRRWFHSPDQFVLCDLQILSGTTHHLELEHSFK